MIESSQQIKILVDLDSLLDTRIGILSLLDSETIGEVAAKGYRTRSNDRFWELAEVDQEGYEFLWANRNVNIALNSLITNIPFILTKVTSKIVEESIKDPTLSKPTVVINTAPYELTSSDLEQLKAVLQIYLGDLIDIETLYLDDNVLTPKFIKENWQIIFKYDFNSWLQKHQETIGECPIPEVTMYIPKLLESNYEDFKRYVEEVDGREKDKKFLKEVGPFEALRLTLLPVLDVVALDVDEYCEIKEAR